jgi:transcriptional regulator with XRE-family HTH domain
MNSLAYYRNKLNFTQETLAEKLSIDRTTVTKWETGQSYPRADKLPDLAKIFNCTIDDLFVEKVD